MDVLTKEQRRKNMRAIKAQNTKIEIKLAKELWGKGYRYRRNVKSVIGKPDLAFIGLKIAIFCDSEFWHGKDWENEKHRIKSNKEFWYNKIEQNIARDIEVNSILKDNGWQVLRFWGKEINKDIDLCIARIEEVINEKKILKYTQIKEKVKFDISKDINNDLAYFTHYIQSSGEKNSFCFKDRAEEYILQNGESNSLFQQLSLPIEWDIPFPPNKDYDFTFIDLFAGIGGIRLAFQEMGGKCVFTSEINDFAKKTYEANFGEVPFGDITKISEKEIPEHDILLAGFPCQPFSIAGVSKKNSLGREHGFLDETQGTLFFDIARILKEKRPKAFLLENVKNLLSHDKGRTFKVISEALRELGYSIHHKIMDGKYFVPQHRERIIIVGFNNKIFNEKIDFNFPELLEINIKIKDILEKEVDNKYTLTDNLWSYLQNYALKHKEKGNGFGFGMTDLNGISRTLSARYYKDGSEILIPQNNKNPRRLTPKECARLQGFPDNYIIPVSDTQAYKQFGNSVVFPLIKSVAKEITKILVEEQKKHNEFAKSKKFILR